MSPHSRIVDLTKPQRTPSPIPPNNAPMTIIDFYSGIGKDPAGRTLNDILSWDVDSLDCNTEYFSTIFPLPKDLSLWGNGPVIDKQVFEAFRNSPELRDRLNDAFKKMLWSLGLKMVESEASGEIIVSVVNNELVEYSRKC
jgi:hypothetical protein